MIRWLKRVALLLLALALVVAVAVWWALRASLPVLDGEAALPGLSAPVSIQRDALGVVTIDAASETDAMRALGYVHAQERYFEMDLMRRTAAGELAELFGPIALQTDKLHRVHRIRARVLDNLDAIAGERLPQLQAYTDGVNAGLAGLDGRPWPYLLLRQQPAPWALADSALTGYAMYFDLQDATNARELALWRMRPHLPPALYALLTRDGTRWDAPLAGEPRGDAKLPGADEVDLRRLPMPSGPVPPRAALTSPLALQVVPPSPAMRERGAGGPPAAADLLPGSNSFAVSGALTVDGRAIVANDMHLGLRAPNIWFRARLRYPDPRAPGGKVDVQGFTLPGLPAVIVGSNGHVAWGFTNSYVDTADWAEVRPCPRDAPTLGDCEPVAIHRETIRVAGADDAVLDVSSVGWGPVLQDDAQRALALRWVAHLQGSLNFGIAALAQARDLDDAQRIADRSALPTQNLVIGDRHGNIAWRLIGPMPGRGTGCSAGTLVETRTGALAIPKPAPAAADEGNPAQGTGLEAAATTCTPWIIATDSAPALVRPAADRLWTANNRIVDGTALRRVGDGGYALGARAKQIRDSLFASQRFSERDLLAIQLDDRALLLAPWWRLLQDTANTTGLPALRDLAVAAKPWQGRASAGSTSYRIVRAWRLAVHARIADGLTAPARAALGEAFEMPNLAQLEGVAWPLVTGRPAHLLARRFASWDELFEDAAREVGDELAQQGPLAERIWGERNTARICHPLSGAVPFLGKRMLCMPPDALAGDTNMPRVAGPAFGASQRMVVAPGNEADGILHMPGGQSGHPLSPFWGAGHEDWVQGRPTPFLPGEPVHTLRLAPAADP
jgi:penicillin amidase